MIIQVKPCSIWLYEASSREKRGTTPSVKLNTPRDYQFQHHSRPNSCSSTLDDEYSLAFVHAGIYFWWCFQFTTRPQKAKFNIYSYTAASVRSRDGRREGYSILIGIGARTALKYSYSVLWYSLKCQIL